MVAEINLYIGPTIPDQPTCEPAKNARFGISQQLIAWDPHFDRELCIFSAFKFVAFVEFTAWWRTRTRQHCQIFDYIFVSAQLASWQNKPQERPQMGQH